MLNNELLDSISNRLDKVALLPKMKDSKSIAKMLEEKGFTRRDFMKWAGAMTAMIGLPSVFAPSVVRAAELADRLP
ncbi:MAG: twin-arginine translocation signal domain-containing protein, partial [Campylobacter sp.]|nr:twin-arginine translocation signal domain-containing protein [Campylobacter sp.]